jgi:hypothetical protein
MPSFRDSREHAAGLAGSALTSGLRRAEKSGKLFLEPHPKHANQPSREIRRPRSRGSCRIIRAPPHGLLWSGRSGLCSLLVAPSLRYSIGDNMYQPVFLLLRSTGSLGLTNPSGPPCRPQSTASALLGRLDCELPDLARCLGKEWTVLRF